MLPWISLYVGLCSHVQLILLVKKCLEVEFLSQSVCECKMPIDIKVLVSLQCPKYSVLSNVLIFVKSRVDKWYFILTEFLYEWGWTSFMFVQHDFNCNLSLKSFHGSILGQFCSVASSAFISAFKLLLNKYHTYMIQKWKISPSPLSSSILIALSLQVTIFLSFFLHTSSISFYKYEDICT